MPSGSVVPSLLLRRRREHVQLTYGNNAGTLLPTMTRSGHRPRAERGNTSHYGMKVPRLARPARPGASTNSGRTGSVNVRCVMCRFIIASNSRLFIGCAWRQVEADESANQMRDGFIAPVLADEGTTAHIRASLERDFRIPGFSCGFVPSLDIGPSIRGILDWLRPVGLPS
jgi:hypothetical protein